MNFPLFNLYLIASLDQIEEYHGSKGLNIVGYFHANERQDDVVKNIGDHIYRHFPLACILLVGNCNGLVRCKFFSC